VAVPSMKALPSPSLRSTARTPPAGEQTERGSRRLRQASASSLGA
jgi:hypothetical protein